MFNGTEQMCSILRNKTLIVNLAYGTKAARENIDKEYSYRKIDVFISHFGITHTCRSEIFRRITFSITAHIYDTNV